MTVYKEAQDNDPTFAAARYAYEAGKEKVVQGRALLLPNVSVSASGTRSYFDYIPGVPIPPSILNIKGNGNTYGYSVNFNQPLYRPQNFAQFRQGRLQTDIAEIQFRGAKQDLILRVAQAYFDVLQAQDNVTFTVAAKSAYAEQLAEAKERFRLGAALITDINESQARFDLAGAQEIEAQNELEVKANALRLLIGKDPGQLSTVSDQMQTPLPDPNNLQFWFEEAHKGNLQLQVQLANEEVSKYEVQRNKDNRLPTLDLVASYSENWATDALTRSGSGTDVTKNGSIGVQFSLPIYSGGGLTSREREAVQNYKRAQQETEALRRNVEHSMKQAYLGIVLGAAQVSAYKQALVSSQIQVDSTKTGQQAGVRTNVDVLNAEQQYYQASFNLAKSRYSYLLSRLLLAAAAGRLNDDDCHW